VGASSGLGSVPTWDKVPASEQGRGEGGKAMASERHVKHSQSTHTPAIRDESVQIQGGGRAKEQ